MGNAQVTGNAGLYYCCYKLSLLGWNVMPTARNARGIDIIAYSPDAKSFCGIQVKTVSKRDAIPLGDSLERMMGDYWVVVNQMASGSPVMAKSHTGSSGVDTKIPRSSRRGTAWGGVTGQCNKGQT
jgi:hypothetical protein